jgi:hypothetical protein
MKKLIVSASVVALAIFATGCVGPNGPLVGTVGGIYSDVSGPVSVTSNSGASKSGSATSKGVLGFAWGDSSIKAASANGGITKVQHVDYHVTSVLGVYCQTIVTVYGE